MPRLRQSLIVFAALIGAAACAAPADAKVKRHVHARPTLAAPQGSKFPVYVSRGVDRNPGGDNLYFTDTKRPNYIVGPAWFQRWE